MKLNHLHELLVGSRVAFDVHHRISNTTSTFIGKVLGYRNGELVVVSEISGGICNFCPSVISAEGQERMVKVL